jgi:hypothetical protein
LSLYKLLGNFPFAIVRSCRGPKRKIPGFYSHEGLPNHTTSGQSNLGNETSKQPVFA